MLKQRLFEVLGKLEKAKALLGKVHPVAGMDGLFVVESESQPGKRYLVDLEAETCTCPAYAQGKTRPCKHLMAAVLSLWLQEKRERERVRDRPGERPVA
jgi:uncharacterized Zn finger protein